MINIFVFFLFFVPIINSIVFHFYELPMFKKMQQKIRVYYSLDVASGKVAADRGWGCWYEVDETLLK